MVVYHSSKGLQLTLEQIHTRLIHSLNFCFTYTTLSIFDFREDDVKHFYISLSIIYTLHNDSAPPSCVRVQPLTNLVAVAEV